MLFYIIIITSNETCRTDTGSHLYLRLFSRVFDGLEDVPGVSAFHLRASNVLTVPSLNQDGGSDG